MMPAAHSMPANNLPLILLDIRKTRQPRFPYSSYFLRLFIRHTLIILASIILSGSLLISNDTYHILSRLTMTLNLIECEQN